MRVPPTIADEILEQVRPLLPAGLALSRVGSHRVNIQTANHEVFGFVQTPWPFLPGPKRFRIKSALADFTGSLCDLVTEATKHHWPGRTAPLPSVGLDIKCCSESHRPAAT